MNKKRYSIDDLGKFDGSKMTIKVNGKQIYPQKRYAIVRVDGKCPYHTTDKAFCIHQQEKRFCLECKIRDRYGDTKEQLISKVAQVLIWKADEIRALKAYKLSREEKKVLDKEYFDLARRIVEFLGVK